MTTETMNIHKALSEQKMIDARIEKEIQTTSFVSSHSSSSKNVDGISVDAFTKNAKSKLDKITDLINRRDAIHRAIQQSNAVTKVSIGGKEYTVAEAIWMNQYGMTMLKKLQATITTQYNRAVKKVDDFNDTLEGSADRFIESVYGNDKEMKKDPEAIARARKDYIDSRKCELVDPVNAVSLMDEYSSKIESFLSDVNTALSTSNAVTEVTIEY